MVKARMGTRNRQSLYELKRWQSEDWTEFLADVAEKGINKAASERALTSSALIAYVQSDADLHSKYREALKARGEIEVDRTIQIADDSADAKLMVDVRWRAAKAWNREVYGAQRTLTMEGGKDLGELLRIAQLRAEEADEIRFAGAKTITQAQDGELIEEITEI